MSGRTLAATIELVRAASDVYADDPTALDALRRHGERLVEPMRIAIAGMTKAGKSTLLNAIIGADVAVTGTGECTRVVTWYRYGAVPSVTVHPVDGEPHLLDIVADAGRLAFDLGPTAADEVDRLVVEWPSELLRSVTLIDTPGLASLTEAVSARAADFLAPVDAPSEVDAVIYVLRHLHVADLTFLRAFRDTTQGTAGVVNAVAVLSRADEIGAGRIDALLSSRDIAERYRHDDTVRSVALGVIPVAGLLAESATTLTPSQFDALVELGRLERGERERLLISSDRFIRPLPALSISVGTRSSLIDRLGIFGIRLAVALIRGGVGDRSALGREFAQRSGLDDLLRLVDRQFVSRADYLTARSALLGVESLLRSRPRADASEIVASLEQITASAHEFRELRLLATARGTGLTLPPGMAAEVERLVGGDGAGAAERLGLGPDAAASDIRDEALVHLDRWRRLSENPLADRDTVAVCRIAVRTCEAVIADAGRSSPVPAALVE